MHQSPQKMPPRQRGRQAEFDAIEHEAEWRLHRAPAPKARKFQWRDEESPRERSERHGSAR
jgi:hypothetical protein